MVWDPTGSIGGALWIGGGQWAGKTTVARLLAFRHGLTSYHYDYHDARGHNDRRKALRLSREEPPEGPDPEDVWVRATPEEMAARTIAGFADRFEWVLDDLRALASPTAIVAEGWGLRPELVAPLLTDLRRMVVLVPTDEFRERQLSRMPRASTFHQNVSDPERAQRNRLERDRLVTADAVESARRLGIRVIEVDGSRDAEAVADEVGRHFGF
jgi:2-phosphoglycerate kinase